eukprot:gb/GECG01000971.1/.p1 GENE.gb/GECG01000971.1/~~gb/GECG01000971.1/.p1  ORF type:complete len:465 (+),score=64.43 gb/GECG01000971.1/:1-1395(+)
MKRIRCGRVLGKVCALPATSSSSMCTTPSVTKWTIIGPYTTQYRVYSGNSGWIPSMEHVQQYMEKLKQLDEPNEAIPLMEEVLKTAVSRDNSTLTTELFENQVFQEFLQTFSMIYTAADTQDENCKFRILGYLTQLAEHQQHRGATVSSLTNVLDALEAVLDDISVHSGKKGSLPQDRNGENGESIMEIQERIVKLYHQANVTLPCQLQIVNDSHCEASRIIPSEANSSTDRQGSHSSQGGSTYIDDGGQTSNQCRLNALRERIQKSSLPLVRLLERTYNCNVGDDDRLRFLLKDEKRFGKVLTQTPGMNGECRMSIAELLIRAQADYFQIMDTMESEDASASNKWKVVTSSLADFRRMLEQINLQFTTDNVDGRGTDIHRVLNSKMVVALFGKLGHRFDETFTLETESELALCWTLLEAQSDVVDRLFGGQNENLPIPFTLAKSIDSVVKKNRSRVYTGSGLE